VVLEFATPLLSLYEMHVGVLANLTEPAMKVERDKFREVLTTILSYKNVGDRCQDKYLIVDYRGSILQPPCSNSRRCKQSRGVAGHGNPGVRTPSHHKCDL